MCGLFGYIGNSHPTKKDIKRFKQLAILSERRGSDSSGIFCAGQKNTSVFKGNSPISKLLLEQSVNSALCNSSVLLGHTRLSTHGSSDNPKHNQPVLKAGFAVFHNGIILENPTLETRQDFNLDSELIVEAALKGIRSNTNLESSLLELIGENTCLLVDPSGSIKAFTNVGNLYTLIDGRGNTWLASEEKFLQQVFHDTPVKLQKNVLKDLGEIPLKGNDYKERNFDFADSISLERTREVLLSPSAGHSLNRLVKLSSFKKPVLRCSNCILPENFPSADFNDQGICRLCRDYLPQVPLGANKLLLDLVELQTNKRVQVNFSGGRDSTYALLYLHENGFNVTACTYDWGFITTAARENMSRICGQLGIEHILVSPNLRKTRKLAATALHAWLKIGDPALIPALMAGDKPQLSTSMKISRELGGLPIIQGDHALESTHFKAALAGAKSSNKKYSGGVSYRLSIFGVLSMGLGYLRLIKKADKYRFALMKQLAESAWIYYVQKHNLIHIFKYLSWDEKTVDTKVRSYGWTSNSRNPKQIWRMGDATAPLYNCLYLLTIGYTEYDALRSNQVRAGLLSRSEALALIESENTFDLNGIHGYLDLIEMDPDLFWNELHKLMITKDNLKGI
jgi:predicted glutamine amidotransferase